MDHLRQVFPMVRQAGKLALSTPEHDSEDGNRFAFGENWARFLGSIDEQAITEAEVNLKEMLETQSLAGLSFLDVGSGSGLSSLVACRLGAAPVSFDMDAQSVASTQVLRARFPEYADTWTIEHGSALDREYLNGLGQFDIVYSWGVLHHSGSMWEAMDNLCLPVKEGGRLWVALYNDQGWISEYWLRVKRSYNQNLFLRTLMIAVHSPYLLGLRILVRLARGQIRLERGMSLWHDMLDWLGGYPFETATPDAVVAFYENRDFRLVKIKTCGRRHGCNDYVFEKRQP